MTFWASTDNAAVQQDVHIEVLHAGDASLEKLHAEHAAAICSYEDQDDCPYGPGPIQRSVSDGHPAASQLWTAPSTVAIAWVVTVLDGESVIHVTATSSNWRDAEDGGDLDVILDSVRILD